MNGPTPLIWDGIRPRLERDVVAHRRMRIGAFDVVAATENLAAPTDWAFEEAHHIIVVHLGGRLDRMDCEFSRGPSGPAIPARGDIWMIPAGCRYAALAQGDRAQFVEIHVPTALLGGAALAARVRHRDDMLFASAARLSGLAHGPDDDIASLAGAALADALQRHLSMRYGRRKAPARELMLSEADKRILADAVRDQLDARHSIESLAARVGLDVRRFSGAFQQGFGMTPWQYVLRMRLDEAARLLRHSDAPVTEVALATGFATPSHFATAFVRRFGLPPSRYRMAAR